MRINSQKCILLITVSVFVLSISLYLKESINPSCCGGLLPGVHYSESDTKPPKIIKRCLKPKNWESFPCTNESSDNCCKAENGENGECIPTDKGGYCQMSNGKKIYKNDTLQNTMFLGVEIDLENPDDYEGDEDLNLSGEDLYDRRRVERDEAIRLKRESDSGNLGYTSEESLISDTQEVLFWIYLLHLLFILALSFALKDSLALIMQGFYDTTVLKYRQFQGY